MSSRWRVWSWSLLAVGLLDCILYLAFPVDGDAGYLLRYVACAVGLC